MKTVLYALLLGTVLHLHALDLVDDAIYRTMAAGLEANPQRSIAQEFQLGATYGLARRYDRAEALYRSHLDLAERHPFIYANLSVYAGKQGKYAEALTWADRAIAAATRLAGDEPAKVMHPTLVKASWLWESGKHTEATQLFTSITIPAAGDEQEELYWACRSCFQASVGDQTELKATIARCLALGSPSFASFVRRDVVFDRYRALPWFIDLVGVTLRP